MDLRQLMEDGQHMTRLEALKLARKYEGLQVYALGHGYGGSAYVWENTQCYLSFKDGILSLSDTSFNFYRIKKDTLRYSVGWSFRNAKKIANTKLAKEIYCGKIIEESPDTLLIFKEMV